MPRAFPLRPVWLAVAFLAPNAAAQDTARPSTHRHVPELAGYLDRVRIAEPVTYRHLAVYPVLVSDDVELRGEWLTLDAAISRRLLVVTEKGSGGSVPRVVVENRGRREHVFIMAGEIISGGKQTRTVRRDVALSPGQRIEVDVFCVEARRWEGGKQFSAPGHWFPSRSRKSSAAAPIKNRFGRKSPATTGPSKPKTQPAAWSWPSRPARSKRSLARSGGASCPEYRTGPPASSSSTVVALGAEFFGSHQLARNLLPKLLDSYAVDCVLLGGARHGFQGETGHDAAIDMFHRICRAGSGRAPTPGSGAGIRTRASRLLGDGVGLDAAVVHYGVQIQDRIVPLPKPGPPLQRRR